MAVHADAVLTPRCGVRCASEPLLRVLQPQRGLQLALTGVGVGRRLRRMVVRIAGPATIRSQIASLRTLVRLVGEPHEAGLLVLLRHGRIVVAHPPRDAAPILPLR